MINSWTNTSFDNISFTSGENFVHKFPDHFHQEYTLGVSVNGIQQFNLLGQGFVVEPYSLFLIRPGQMHAHYPVADVGWSFKSMYISPDLMSYLLKFTGSKDDGSFLPIMQDRELFKTFINIYDNRVSPTESGLVSFIELLCRKLTGGNHFSTPACPQKLEGIKSHLATHLDEKLNLDRLGKKFRMDKYELIRQFKKHAGVTPNVYLTILRIEKARQLINQQHSLVDTALEVGFYDQSHFHHNFLYYTGVTPGNFHKPSR